MQRRIYAPMGNQDSAFSLTKEEKQMSMKIIHQKPFQTPNNASKRLLDVIKKIELRYALHHEQSEDYDAIDGQTDSIDNNTLDDTIDDNFSFNRQKTYYYDINETEYLYGHQQNEDISKNSQYLNNPEDNWFLDSPIDDQEFIKPHQSSLEHQFQRISRNQEKKKQEFASIKKKIEYLDNEYELMEDTLGLSF